ncbi:hypothetical protein [Clostridium sp.]|uniref:hypothetical protein n=1 Tax=Clostridium sp. TaxID=1506 RepID=UPI00290EFE39|nr:hypothetical protein [Clostridium sp.]MDU7212473.1 hypothetical protein [Clostridium sp.]
MISEFYVECLAKKIINKEINLYTNNPFCIEDIKKEEYIEPVKMKIEEMGELDNGLSK